MSDDLSPEETELKLPGTETGRMIRKICPLDPRSAGVPPDRSADRGAEQAIGLMPAAVIHDLKRQGLSVGGTASLAGLGRRPKKLKPVV